MVGSVDHSVRDVVGVAMIVVSVQLDSAIASARDRELARVHISNVSINDKGTLADYKVESMRGRSAAALDKCIVQRRGRVVDHPRQREHVLNLVAKALLSMGYGK